MKTDRLGRCSECGQIREVYPTIPTVDVSKRLDPLSEADSMPIFTPNLCAECLRAQSAEEKDS